MLIDLRCRLRAAVAVRDLEMEGRDSMLAEGALERRAAIHRFDCVMSHLFMLVLQNVWASEQWVRNLRAGNARQWQRCCGWSDEYCRLRCPSTTVRPAR